MPAAKNDTSTMLTKAPQSPVDTSQLPPNDDSSLVLELASPEEHEHTWRLNVDEWKGCLNEEEYYFREQYLLTAPLTNKGQMVAWVLTSPALPQNADGTRPILASCETLLKNAYVARDGKVEKILAHGIGSVYCRPEYRGKGYAGRMISELGKKLETFQQHNGTRGTFSVLYSDIGKKFYAKHKWEPFPSDHISLESLNVPKDALSSDLQDLSTSDLASISTTKYMEENLTALSKMKPGVPHVAIRPDLAHFRWHHMREEHLASATGRPFPEIKGAIHKSTGIALIWNRVFSPDPAHDTLSILLVVIPPAMQSHPHLVDILSALLLRAQHEAFVSKMRGGVEIWDPSEVVIQAAQKLRKEEDGKIKIITRDAEHICSLRWNGPEKEVFWVGNERYAWC